MKKILFNPFEKYDGKPMLVIGLLSILAGSFLGYCFNTRFDGIIDIHFPLKVLITESFIENVFNMTILFFVLYIFGFSINKKTRPIDILSTVMVARLPLYLATLTNITNFMSVTTDKIKTAGFNITAVSATDITFFTILSLLTLPFLVWYITLLYNGIKTATNLKATSQKIWFAIVIIIAEIFSKILFYIIYQ